MPRGMAYEAVEARLHLSVTRDLNGFDVPDPSADSRVIYVSATGSDGNNGLSPTSPVQSVAKGRSLVRDGVRITCCCEQGDTLSTPISGWSISGRWTNEPMVIGQYTRPGKPSTDRPHIDSSLASGFANAASSGNHPAMSHLVIEGINFVANRRDYRNPPSNFTTAFTANAAGGTYGMNLLGSVTDFLVEDCNFQYFRTGLASRGSPAGAIRPTSPSTATTSSTATPTTTRTAITSRPRASTPTTARADDHGKRVRPQRVDRHHPRVAAAPTPASTTTTST